MKKESFTRNYPLIASILTVTCLLTYSMFIFILYQQYNYNNYGVTAPPSHSFTDMAKEEGFHLECMKSLNFTRYSYIDEKHLTEYCDSKCTTRISQHWEHINGMDGLVNIYYQNFTCEAQCPKFPFVLNYSESVCGEEQLVRNMLVK